jgi:hypothetical protein
LRYAADGSLRVSKDEAQRFLRHLHPVN